ncbi:MAG TPA: hypothetical protein VGL71_12295 [Urbifossiella sp.]|jgi:hypothetical protein
MMFVLGYYVAILLGPSGNDPSNSWIFVTALPVVFWPLAARLPFTKRTEYVAPGISDAEFTRAIYGTLCILFMFHVAIAFHLGHGWSHRAAYEHTARVGGFGTGIYVNYLFALVWIADVIWALIAFDHYLKRPAWLNWLVIGFMGFVWFNAVIVFGNWVLRFIVICFVMVWWFTGWWIRRSVRIAKSRAPRCVAAKHQS